MREVRVRERRISDGRVSYVASLTTVEVTYSRSARLGICLRLLQFLAVRRACSLRNDGRARP